MVLGSLFVYKEMNHEKLLESIDRRRGAVANAGG